MLHTTVWAFLGPEGTSLETPEPWPGASRDDLIEVCLVESQQM